MAKKAEEAVNSCRRGMSICHAANFYGIPKSTTCDKVNGKTPIVHMARIGYGQTGTDVLDKVEELLNKLNIKKMFSDSSRPSIKWYTLFMARHPDLQMRMTSALSCARCNVSQLEVLVQQT